MQAADIARLPLRPFGAAASALRRRFRRWWEARLPRSDTLLLTQRNIYILPTSAGLMFALTLLVLLVASINYQLNLGYVLTFLLASSGVVSMHLTHNTLRGLTLHLKPVTPVFAGESATLEAVLTSAGGARHGIGMRVESAPASTLTWLDVPAGDQTTARVSFVPPVRGRHGLPTLAIETRFPLGLFRAWSVWRPSSHVLVYPTPERPPAPLPPAGASPDGPARSHRVDGGEVDGIRAYRRGDPLKTVVWKKAAKSLESGGDLISRDTLSTAHQTLWLDWQSANLAGTEARLSRLAGWVLLADKADMAYGLRLPRVETARSSGEAHRRMCLEALALFA